jgi:hypothetical protein
MFRGSFDLQRGDGDRAVSLVWNDELKKGLALWALGSEPAGTSIDDPDCVPAVWAFNQHRETSLRGRSIAGRLPAHDRDS